MHQNRVLNHKDRTWTREWMFGVWVVKTVGGKSVIWSALNSRSTCLFIVSICDFIAPVGLGLKFYFKMASICLLFSSPGSAFIFNSYSFASCFSPHSLIFFICIFAHFLKRSFRKNRLVNHYCYLCNKADDSVVLTGSFLSAANTVLRHSCATIFVFHSVQFDEELTKGNF